MKLIIIDVRSPAEYAEGHYKGAVNIPLNSFENYIDKLDKDDNILVYCASGSRSSVAVRMLQDRGFSKAVNAISQQQLKRVLG